MRDSYWDQRSGPSFLLGLDTCRCFDLHSGQGERIREQPEAMFRRGLLKEHEQVGEAVAIRLLYLLRLPSALEVLPFRAKPVPVGVLTPRMQDSCSGV